MDVKKKVLYGILCKNTNVEIQNYIEHLYLWVLQVYISIICSILCSQSSETVKVTKFTVSLFVQYRRPKSYT